MIFLIVGLLFIIACACAPDVMWALFTLALGILALGVAGFILLLVMA